MLSHRRASRLFGSALLLSVTFASQVHAMPVIGQLERLHASTRPDESDRNLAQKTAGATQTSAVEMRKATTTADAIESSGSSLLRLDQQTLILVIAGFAAALSLMARLR